jgi:acetolactate synthase-1/2/3 large subunit
VSTQTTDQTSEQQTEVHGGHIVAKRLKANGVDTLFTLSGAHLFSLYDGCREEGIRLIDVRHEQTAAFAAEGWAKVTRTPGVCAVTAGPGVTNGMSALASAQSNGSPMLMIGGRAPEHRWGSGSLQEIDHIPFVEPLTQHASTVREVDDLGSSMDDAFARLARPSTGPVFLDMPLDVLFTQGKTTTGSLQIPSSYSEDHVVAQRQRAVELLATAERPVVMAGTGLYWAGAESELRQLAEHSQVPVFVNGLGRGTIPADHPMAFSRTRGQAFQNADVAIIVGTPMDFRLGFGQVFGPETKIIWIDSTDPHRPHPRTPDVEIVGNVAQTIGALSRAEFPDRSAWVGELRAAEDHKRATGTPEFDDDRAPLHPLRIYKDLRDVLDRNATVVCDGGDFVSFGGRQIDSYEPGSFLDPGPFGCLGSGPGYALAAALARPDRQTCMIMGDGAFGFAGMEFDTFVRHNLPVVAVMGNNGIWGLEKHPMEMLFGYAVVADLTPETRYDQVVEALGGHGEFVRTPDELRPALDRAFASGKPALVNVLTDPSVAYPRSTNLA